MQVGKDRSAPGGTFRLAPQDLPVPADATAGGDFPVSIEASKKHDVLYILTKMGYAYLYGARGREVGRGRRALLE